MDRLFAPPVLPGLLIIDPNVFRPEFGDVHRWTTNTLFIVVAADLDNCRNYAIDARDVRWHVFGRVFQP